MASESRESSGYFPSQQGDLYGTCYLPAELASATGAVLVEPFGEEKRCAYRMLVRLARALAAQGVAVLRFDLQGTGDSPGDHGAMDLAAWTAAVRAAAECLLATEGIDAWAPIAARFGALPAVTAVAARPARAVVLLEPVLNGAEFLRDLERRQRIKDMMSGKRDADGPDAPARWQAGETVDFGGFPVGPQLAAQLEGVDLCPMIGSLPEACALQVVRVSGSQKLPAAWQPLAEATAARAIGETKIVQDKPFWGQLEYYESDAVIAAVLAFLARALHLPMPQTGEPVS